MMSDEFDFHRRSAMNDEMLVLRIEEGEGDGEENKDGESPPP